MKWFGIATITVTTLLALGSQTPAMPSYGAGCMNCHDLRGAMTATAQDTSADPMEACGSADRGPLNVFQVTPGSTKTLSGVLSGVDATASYALVVKGFENTGVEQCGTLSYAGDAAWVQRGTAPLVYYTRQGPAALNFELTVGASTPPDFYDLIVGAAGVDGTGMFYAESHVYVQVVAPSTPTPIIALDTASLTPTSTEGTTPADATFTVGNGGQGMLDYTVAASEAWLTVSPSSASSSGAANVHTVQYSTAALAAGTYSATITISDPAAVNNPQVIMVTLTVNGNGTVEPPTIVLSRTSLVPTAPQGTNPAADQFTVANGAAGTLNYAITTSEPWLSVLPAGGTSAGSSNTHTVQYNAASLPAGTHVATILVTDAQAANSPRTIAVNLTITASPPVDTGSDGNNGDSAGVNDSDSGVSVPDDDSAGTAAPEEALEQGDAPALGLCGAGAAGLVPALLLALAAAKTNMVRRATNSRQSARK